MLTQKGWPIKEYEGKRVLIATDRIDAVFEADEGCVLHMRSSGEKGKVYAVKEGLDFVLEQLLKTRASL